MKQDIISVGPTICDRVASTYHGRLTEVRVVCAYCFKKIHLQPTYFVTDLDCRENEMESVCLRVFL